ncbi:PHP domain-containing protein [Spirochaeta cellobiosiphila]|uniref:PHP domain-containing protein n=1 Tax=Spirochaeta cellobiosiphila TaxID=504483 RepID=UPI0004250CEA|nr:PHP domain-containing protein [Spirochaeta cellobiosiphila]
MLIDLHLHSWVSDGSYSPRNLMKLAQERGIAALSLTDHDTVEHQGENESMASRFNLLYLRGIEISAFDPDTGRKVHILGYQYNRNPYHIQDLCSATLKKRHNNTLEQIQIIQAQGYPVTVQEVEDKAYCLNSHSRCLYKQHIMAVLKDKKITTEIYSDLYRELFKSGGIAARDISYVTYHDAIAAIKADGGIPVLAHPGQSAVYDLVPHMVYLGLQGIELAHPDHSSDDYKKVRALANEYDLICTGGSDFHGEYGKEDALGLMTVPPGDWEILKKNCLNFN